MHTRLLRERHDAQGIEYVKPHPHAPRPPPHDIAKPRGEGLCGSDRSLPPLMEPWAGPLSPAVTQGVTGGGHLRCGDMKHAEVWVGTLGLALHLHVHTHACGLVNPVFHRLATAPAPKAGPFTTRAAHGGYPQLAWDSFHTHVVRSRVGAPAVVTPTMLKSSFPHNHQPQSLAAPRPSCLVGGTPWWSILCVAQLSRTSQDGKGALSSPGVRTELPSFLL